MLSQSIIATFPIRELTLSGAAGAERGWGCHAGAVRAARNLIVPQSSPQVGRR
jgi:hypothetical protein